MEIISVKTVRAQIGNLKKGWKEISPKQKIYQAPNKRLAISTSNLDFLKGKNVLDIGCNQGLHSMMLSSRVKKVVGLEVIKSTYQRALYTHEHFKKIGFKLDNVSFVNVELKDFNDYKDINAILSCCCIYNMDDSNIENFKRILKQCDRIIYQTRPTANNRIKDRSKYNLCLETDVINFLKKEGFVIVDHQFSDTKWPIFYAKRK